MAIRIIEAEALHYMGVPEQADAATLACLRRAAAALTACAMPRHTLRTLPVGIEANAVTLPGCAFPSADLAMHLRGCEQAILFAATLGVAVDRLLLRATVGGMEDALALQACAASAIESYCDDCCAALALELAAQGLYLRPRFSPGYGDFALENQRALLRLLHADKAIGLSLTSGYMLTPVKSVTAVIGLGAAPPAENCLQAHKCAACPKRDCAYRKGETA